jgi:hypothetical protein
LFGYKGIDVFECLLDADESPRLAGSATRVDQIATGEKQFLEPLKASVGDEDRSLAHRAPFYRHARDSVRRT